MDDKARLKRIFAFAKLFMLIVIVIGVPVFLYVNYKDTLFDPDWLRGLPAVLERHRSTAARILIGFQILQVIICVLPGQPIQYVSSYFFGILRGYLISIAGAVIGAAAAFYLARLLGQDALHVIFDKEKVEDYRRKLNSGKGLLAVLLIYLIPGIPKDLVGYAAGISEMEFRPFIIVSTIGRSPAMIGSLLIGHFMGQKNYAAVVIVSVVFIMILAVCFIKRKDLVKKLDELEDSLDDNGKEPLKDGKETEN